MNIFILDRNISKSVSYHTDTHVRKILIEAVQMLSIAAAYNVGLISDTVDTTGKRRYAVFLHSVDLYKYTKSQASHPCSVWARSCHANALWLLEYAQALVAEYRHRFDKKPAPNILVTLRNCKNLLSKPKQLPEGKLSGFHQCMPDRFRKRNAVSAYRDYYYHEKQGKYTKRKVPAFMAAVSQKKTTARVYSTACYYGD